MKNKEIFYTYNPTKMYATSSQLPSKYQFNTKNSSNNDVSMDIYTKCFIQIWFPHSQLALQF